MKTQSIPLFFFVALCMCGCGGKSVAADGVAPDAGSADGSSGTGGTAGTGGGGTGGGTAGVAGTGGNTGGTAGTGGTGVGGTGVGGTAGTAGGAAGAGGSICDMTTTEPGCDACMNTSCMSECDGCAGNTQCVDFVLCALACSSGDSACIQSCVTDHPDGVADGLPLIGPDGCLRQSCNSECIVAGVTCDISVGDPACDDCVAGSCMSECTACAENSSCVDLMACAEACAPDDQGCVMQCAAQNIGGAGDANAFAGDNGCVDQYCGVECNGAPAQCAIEFGEPGCDACISDRCLSDCNACAESAACIDLVACALTCPPDDQGCLGQCAMENPTGIAAANAFAGDNGCVEQKCAVECGTGSATCTISSGNAACDACIGTECGGSCAACSENPECEALVACYFACPSGDFQCQIQCSSENPGGLQAAGALIGPTGCVSSDCSFWCP